MKRNIILSLTCTFVDETNGINSLYKIFYKRIPIVLDVLSREMQVIELNFIESDNIVVNVAVSPLIANKIKDAFKDSVNNHTVFDMSINGIDIIPFQLIDSINKSTARGFKPTPKTRFSWSR